MTAPGGSGAPPDRGAPARGSRRLLTVVVLLAVVGAALLLLATSQHWLAIRASRPAPLPRLNRRITGSTAEPALRALGLVDLAGALALLGTRRIGRRIVGGLLAVSGVLGAILAARDVLGVPDGRARALLAPDGGQVIGLDPGSRLTVATASGWIVLAVATSALVATAGGVAAVRAGRMPMMGVQYDAPVGHGRPLDHDSTAWTGPTAPCGPAVQAVPTGAAEPAERFEPTEPTDRGMWDALDRGADPTAPPEAPRPAAAPDPVPPAVDGRRSRPERAG